MNRATSILVLTAVAVAATVGCGGGDTTIIKETGGGSTDEAEVLVGEEYKPARDWCPTNRTCFSNVTWTTYDAESARGAGPAEECAGGGLGCRRHANVEMSFSKPERACGEERFTRLEMFGNNFVLDENVCNFYLPAAPPQ